jgi:molecular chaperone GrpE (heat shock protein)
MADTSDFLEHNKINIRFLEDQIEKLNEKLKQKKSDYEEITNRIKESEEIVKYSNNSHTGLYFRFV